MTRQHGSVLVLAVVGLAFGTADAQADMIDMTWRDNFSFTTANAVGVETIFQFTVDTHLIVGTDTLRKGQTTTYDYTQTYLMTTDPTVLGFTRGNPELIPANLFPTEPAIGDLERLYPKHFEHDLFIDGCAQFNGQASATLKTNSPAPNGLNSITIGPIGIGGSAAGAGDTNYTLHDTATKTYLDWVTRDDRGGFFFNGGAINIKGEIIGIADEGNATLFTNNMMFQSANNTLFPLYILADGQDVLFNLNRVNHGVQINCVPAPPGAVLAMGGFLLLTLSRRVRRSSHGRN